MLRSIGKPSGGIRGVSPEEEKDGYGAVADPGFLQGGCGSWCLWSAPRPFMPSLPPTVKKISWELAAR